MKVRKSKGHTVRQMRTVEGRSQRAGPQKGEYKPFIPGPNPELDEFIREHSIPYQSENDSYEVLAFELDLIVDKVQAPKAIYSMHRYWSQKHWAAICEYIRHYLPRKFYPKGTGLVLDCFSGSGMTGVAAMMEGRSCVLIDASPAAAFISHCYTHPVDPAELEEAYELMLIEPYPEDLRRKLKEIIGGEINNLAEELDWLYGTRCDRCGGNATTEYVIYSERFQCPKCGEIINLFDCPETKVSYPAGSKSSPKTELKKKRVCPSCLAKNGFEPHRDFVISTRSKKFGPVPVVVSYHCLDGCKPARSQRNHRENPGTRKHEYFKKYDIEKIQAIEIAKIPHWYPKRRMMDTPESQVRWGVKYRAGVASFQNIQELYDSRNLWALAAWLEQSKNQVLELAITKACLQSSKMNGNRSQGGGLTAGKYLIPPESRILNASNRLDSAVKKVISGMRQLVHFKSPGREAILVHNADASSLHQVEDSIVDYVFTDPPYLNLEVQYGEMNFVWEAWLGQESKWLSNEIVLNPVRGIFWDDAVSRLRTTICEIFRVLKPGRFASICYHDTSEMNWSLIQNALLDAGFIIENVLILDPKQK
ncbi:MAG: DNA methyltransferase [Syntrophobacteraceae bacterium]